ncbi:MAG: hypothetical protein IT559_02730 [Alphaproteobacteria bacterium]|nr:hypothetical protein [Alphaproteobacteria bacterium]
MIKTIFKSISVHALWGAAALFLASAYLWVTPAAAASDRQDHSAHIKAIFSAIMDEQIRNVAANADDSRQIQYDGELSVEPVEDYYAVTMPRMSVLYPDGEKLDIGMISINVTAPEIAKTPPGQWKMTLALPTPILGYNAEGVKIMRLAIGTQKAAGIWDENLKNFIKLDAQYSDLQIDFPLSQGHIAISGIAIRYNLGEDREKRWSGPLSFELLNAGWDIPAPKRLKGELGKLALHIDLKKFSTDYLKESNALFPGKFDFLNPAFLKTGDGIKTTFSLSNLKTDIPAPQPKGSTEKSVKIDDAVLSFDLQNVLSGTANAAMNLTFNGLDIQPAPDANSTDAQETLLKLVPARGHIGIEHKNIPIAGITQTLSNSTGQNNPMAGLGLFLKLPGLYAQAGSLLRIKDSSIGNALYRIDINGEAKADITAALSAIAAGKITLAGLDQTLALLNTASADKNSPDLAMTASNIKTTLENMKHYGNARTNTGTPPEPIYDFDFKLDQTGAFTVNGKNAMPLFMPGQIRHTPPPAAP